MLEADGAFEGIVHISCDKCGFSEELDADDFSEANEEARDKGWTKDRKNGSWRDICPPCSEDNTAGFPDVSDD